MPAFSPAANAGTVRIVVAKMPKTEFAVSSFVSFSSAVRKYPRACRVSASASNAARQEALYERFRKKLPTSPT
jgi:hypothetical protein